MMMMMMMMAIQSAIHSNPELPFVFSFFLISIQILFLSTDSLHAIFCRRKDFFYSWLGEKIKVQKRIHI